MSQTTSSPSAPQASASVASAPPIGSVTTADASTTLLDSASQVTDPNAAPAPGVKLKVHQPGWWKVGGIKGLKAHVARAVKNIPEIPSHWQAALQAEIAAHDSPAVAVTAHCMQQNQTGAKGKIVLHLDISPVEGWAGPE